MATGAGHVLLVSDNTSLTTMATVAADGARCQLTCLAELGSARELIAKKQFDLILVDACARERKELDRFLATDMTHQGRVVVAGGVGLRVNGLGASTLGNAVEQLPGQLSFDALKGIMNRALRRTPSREIPPGDGFSGMIGRTVRMQALFENIRRAAPLDVGVLVQGESGTGKELVAQAIHRLSGRTGEFIAVNCGAVSPELLGSQIFGHERGSFTGATQAHAGYFEQARGGTLFLDEITEMPYPLQVYLLRVIETHALTRVGGSQEIPVDVRVIAASNRDLQRAVAAGLLREDLYFRLLEFPLALPPLRERREDIPLLARHFLNGLNIRYGTDKRFSDEVLCQYSLRAWPGNVRELRHAVQRQYILAGESGDLAAPAESGQPLHRRSSDLAEPVPRSDPAPTAHASPYAEDGAVHFSIGTTTFEAIEREVLLKTLAHFHNNKREAARALGVSLKTVYNKLLRYRAQGLIGEDVLDEPPEHNGRAA